MTRSTLSRRLLAGVLLLALPAGPALAAGQAVTIYDQRDNALGTTANPLMTAGSGTVTSNQGSPNVGGTAAWYVQWSGQSVAVSSMPAVVQGAAGTSPWLVAWSGQSVAVSALPSIPAGTNVIGAVTQSGGPWSVSGNVAATQSGTWTVGLNAGSAAIGTVGVTSLPSIPAGSNTIGAVSVSNFPASQPVTNAGAFAVQNTAAVVGGNATAVKVDGSAVTQPVSGTVTANLGTLNGAATAAGQAAQQGPVAPGAASANSVLGGTVYNSTPPAPTNGQQLALQADAAGNLKVSTAAPLPAGSNVIGGTNIYEGGTAVSQGSPLHTQSMGYYFGTLPTVGGGFNVASVDVRGQWKTSETGSSDPLVGITPAVTQSGTVLVGKAAAGNLYAYAATNLSTTAGFVAVVNSATAPASGAAILPLECRILPASGSTDKSYNPGPPPAYSTGIVVLITTSCSTYTPGGAAFVNALVR